MSESGKLKSTAKVSSIVDRMKTLDEIYSQYRRIVENTPKGSERRRKADEILDRYVQNMRSVPEIRDAKDMIKNLALEENPRNPYSRNGEKIGELNRIVLGTKVPRSVYAKNR